MAVNRVPVFKDVEHLVLSRHTLAMTKNLTEVTQEPVKKLVNMVFSSVKSRKPNLSMVCWRNRSVITIRKRIRQKG